VEVIGASPNKGQAVLALFTSAENFLKEPHVTMIAPIDSDGRVVTRVNRLNPGRYAVSVYCDEDNNGKLTCMFHKGGCESHVIAKRINLTGRLLSIGAQ